MNFSDERRLAELRYKSQRNRNIVRAIWYTSSILPALLSVSPSHALAQSYEFVREGGGTYSWGGDGFKPIDPKREKELPHPSNEIDLDLSRPKTTVTFDLDTFDPSLLRCDIGISEALYRRPTKPNQPQVVIVGRPQPLFEPRRYEIVARDISVDEQAHIAFSSGLEQNEINVGIVVTVKKKRNRRNMVDVTIEPVFSIKEPEVSGPLTPQGVMKASSQLDRIKRQLNLIYTQASRQSQIDGTSRDDIYKQRSAINRQIEKMASISEYSKQIHQNSYIYIRAHVANQWFAGKVK